MRIQWPKPIKEIKLIDEGLHMFYCGFDIRQVDEHYEVFDRSDRFCFSADTIEEAMKAIYDWTFA